jgi:phycobilisome core linker protein
LQNTFFTKLVPFDNWFAEQQRIMKMGGKIVRVELATGKVGANTGLQ